jgi:hypothetical protein
MTHGKVFSSWKRARTILKFKKGDRGVLANWRPLSISDSMYRIFTGMIARSWQKINVGNKIFSDSQKGFIKGCNGCTEHAVILNELFHDARREDNSLIVTAIDFTNAFGSVPHDLIMSTLRQRGFPAWMQDIIEDIYTGGTTSIEVKGRTKVQSVNLEKGVRQGCPLSPLIFNLCLEPLLQYVNSELKHCGASVGPPNAERLAFTVQAYADDVALISRTREGMETLLAELEEFTDWAQMEVNVKKCATISYMYNRGTRSTLKPEFLFKGKKIEMLDEYQAIKYLGTPVAAKRATRAQAAQTIFDEAKDKVNKIIESELTFPQKLDAIKTFVTPSLDFILMGGDPTKEQCEELDTHIRKKIMELLTLNGYPTEIFYLHWKDGGMSLQMLEDRRKLLTIRTFIHMMTCEDRKIVAAMKWWVDQEREKRKGHPDNRGKFMDWPDEIRGGDKGTSCLAWKARQAAQELGIQLKIVRGRISIRYGNEFIPLQNPKKLGQLLNEKVIRLQKLEALFGKEIHGLGFRGLLDNEHSNRVMVDLKAMHKDEFYTFLLKCRADKLPTPANVNRWYPRKEGEPEIVSRCCVDAKQHPDLMHVLTGCVRSLGGGRIRHNAMLEIVVRAIYAFVTDVERSAVFEDVTFGESGLMKDEKLTGNNIDLRPDIYFKQRLPNGKWVITVVEGSCPGWWMPKGGDISKEGRMYDVDKIKAEKYLNWAREVQQVTGLEVRIFPIIISAIGTVFPDTIKNLGEMLNCRESRLKYWLQQMSVSVVYGSWHIWTDFCKWNHSPEAEVPAGRLPIAQGAQESSSQRSQTSRGSPSQRSQTFQKSQTFQRSEKPRSPQTFQKSQKAQNWRDENRAASGNHETGRSGFGERRESAKRKGNNGL